MPTPPKNPPLAPPASGEGKRLAEPGSEGVMVQRGGSATLGNLHKAIGSYRYDNQSAHSEKLA